MPTINSITVHLRVNDAASSKPTPVRLRIAGPDGEYFAPFGRVAQFPVGHNEDVGGNVYLATKRSTYIDGSCEIRLPTGVPLDVEISKGPEYQSIKQTITLGPGQMALRFTVQRAANRHEHAWMSADSRSHFLSPHDALLEAAAEDLDLVHLLATEQDMASQDGHLYRTIPNMTAFSGQRPALSIDPGPAAQARESTEPLLALRALRSTHQVVVNTFNTHPALGRLSLLNSHRPVFPLSFGGDATDDWSLTAWCEQCHRKKGLVVWCDAYRPETGLAGGEALAAAILGKIDAIELDARDRQQPFLPLWYRLLNAGVLLPIVGGSGKDCNRIALGSMRTYTSMVHETSIATCADDVSVGSTGNPSPKRSEGGLLDPPSLRFGLGSINHAVGNILPNWVERTRAGRTFVTNGPMLSLQANDVMPGDLLRIEPGRKIAIRASVISSVPYDGLEIIANGEVVASGGSNTALEIEHELPEGGWIAARCRGAAKSVLDLRSPLFAHTSPVRISVTGRPRPISASSVRSLIGDLEQVRLWVERDGRFEFEKSKAQLLQICDDALRVLAERLAGN